MSLLHSLDVFSGIGGVTLALHGVAVPCAYCESNPAATAVLRHNMDLGNIPTAPICADVRHLTSAWLKSHQCVRPDLLIGGFPCVGFSIIGHRKGFANKHSAMFYEMLRVYDESGARMIFLENVPSIMRFGMSEVIKQLSKRKMTAVWCQLSARDVGAPHIRKRWYCLAYQQNTASERAWAVRALHRLRHSGFEWHREPPRTLCHSRDSRPRHKLLGNSVVPDAVRHAFRYLITADPTCHSVDHMHGGGWPAHGACLSTGPSSLPCCALPGPSPLKQMKRLNLTFDPRAYVPDRRGLDNPHRLHVAQPIASSFWATPTHSASCASKYLTRRSKTMLSTQVRFEIHTPNDKRECALNPWFLEWLMGFPRDWTIAATSNPND